MSVPPVTWQQAAPFTVAQWQELEHQALIFKYLKAGLTVPPDLLVPIRRSLQLMSPKLSHSLHYPSLGYYGKKIDPEPGRCRRTDGKKWRCSRDAHPDSKYCDRHMIRRRYRSRKPVESSSSSSQQQQQQPQSQSSSTTASQLSTTAGATTGAAGSASGTFHTLPLHTNGTREGFTLGSTNNNSSSSGNNSLQHHLQMDPLSLPGEVSKKEFRFALNTEADEHNFLQKDLGSVRYQGYDFTSDGMWSMSQIPSNTVSESRTGSTMVGECFQQQTIREAELLNLNAARSKELVFSGQLSSAGCLKQEYQSPHSLFSDWHWKKDIGSDAIVYRPSKDFNSDANVDCNGSL